jgi:hypothetical protein
MSFRSKLVLLLSAAALLAGTASAAGGNILATRQITVKPSGTQLKLVASKTNLDTKRTGRIALWLTSYKKSGSAWKKIAQVKTIAPGFKLSSHIVSFKVFQLKGSTYANTAEVHIKWFITPAIGARTYSFIATPTQLGPVN